MFKKIALAAVTIPLAFTLTSCFETAAEKANDNLSTACDNFECPRRIVGINGITDTVLFSVEGFCSYSIKKDSYEALCLIDRKTGEVQRTTLGRSDNVTMAVTQIGGVDVDLFRPRVIFRPESIVPNFDLSTSDNPTEQ
jgi:hypothetical protein